MKNKIIIGSLMLLSVLVSSCLAANITEPRNIVYTGTNTFNNTLNLATNTTWLGTNKLQVQMSGILAHTTSEHGVTTNKYATNGFYSGGFRGGTSSFAAGGGGAIGNQAISYGGGAGGLVSATWWGGSIGYGAVSSNGGAIGYISLAKNGGAVGWGAVAGDGFAGGKSAHCTISGGLNTNWIDAIQLGTGGNTNPYSLKIYGYTLMNSNGTIPSARIDGTNLIGVWHPGDTVTNAVDPGARTNVTQLNWGVRDIFTVTGVAGAGSQNLGDDVNTIVVTDSGLLDSNPDAWGNYTSSGGPNGWFVTAWPGGDIALTGWPDVYITGPIPGTWVGTAAVYCTGSINVAYGVLRDTLYTVSLTNTANQLIDISAPCTISLTGYPTNDASKYSKQKIFLVNGTNIPVFSPSIVWRTNNVTVPTDTGLGDVTVEFALAVTNKWLGTWRGLPQ